MGVSPWLIRFQTIVDNTAADKLARIVDDENTNIAGLVIAYADPEKRKQVFDLLPMDKRKKVAAILGNLLTPPDFVLETICKTLENKIKYGPKKPHQY